MPSVCAMISIPLHTGMPAASLSYSMSVGRTLSRARARRPASQALMASSATASAPCGRSWSMAGNSFISSIFYRFECNVEIETRDTDVHVALLARGGAGHQLVAGPESTLLSGCAGVGREPQPVQGLLECSRPGKREFQ